MRKGERPFAVTRYARLSEKRAATSMLERGYCQVSRRFGYVSRVDVSDETLLVKCGLHGGSCLTKYNDARSWYDYYRRCISVDVITDVPEPIMFMIRKPGMMCVPKPPQPSDEEFVAMMITLGLT